MMKTRLLLTLPLLCLLVACSGTIEMGVEGQPTPDVAPTMTALAADNASLATRVATLAATPRPGVAPPPGLVYRAEGRLWRVEADGQARQLADRPDALLSPDGARALYLAEDDIWLLDLATASRRNLSNTPDRIECCPAWWPARPDLVLFCSRPIDLEVAEGTSGFLASVGLDGSGYRVLDDRISNSAWPAPSPDGRTIAYGFGEWAWLYRWDAGPERFDPAAYGLTGSKGVRIGSPAWSPDGKRLAWVTGGGLGSDWRIGIGTVDLEARTGQFLHPYEPIGRGGWPPAPTWSPDGKWLAFTTSAWDRREDGLWVIRADGLQEEEFHFGVQGTCSAWSPDGERFAFSHPLANGKSVVWMAQAGTWEMQQVDLPDGAQVVAWLPPMP
jgi:dipeptidyl aminopeptidase/acylaminoacyl peptidase